MINSTLERQAKSTDELLRRLVEERDGKKLDTTSVNPSSTCAVSFTQTNPHTSGASAGGTSIPNPSTQLMNHFHSRTTIEGSAPTFRMPQQTMATCLGKGRRTPHLVSLHQTLPQPSYILGGNGRAYVHFSSNYQTPYTDSIPLPGNSLGFLPNHAYQNPPCFNAYGQPEVGGFGYETPPQFPFRSQLIDMTPARVMTEPDVDPNNLTNQLATILCESFGIEPKDRGCVYQKSYPDYYDQLPYPKGYRIPEFSKFSRDDGKTILEHVSQFILQCGEANANDALKLGMFRLSLSRTIFIWFTSLTPNYIFTWAQLEQKFHEYFYSGDTDLRLSHLTIIKQKHNEPIADYIGRFRDTKNQCFNLNIFDKNVADLAYLGLTPHLKEKLESHIFFDVSQVL
jgi:hypothetical protein